jgi:hypothetical protein
MDWVTSGYKVLLKRWIRSALAAGLIVLVGYCPAWGHDARHHSESVSSLTLERFDASLAGYEFLAKKSKKWKDLSPEEKKQLRKKYKEWQSLSPEEKEEIRRRMKRLKKMSPREREAYRQLYQKWRHLPPHERRQLKNELDNWENLSPRQQEVIRRRFMK